MEYETLNSSRSYTSHSRKVPDCDSSKLIVQVPNSGLISQQDLSYCKHCMKDVEVTYSFPNDSKLESKIVEFFSYFFVCWEPSWAKSHQIATCTECENVI